MTSSVAIGGRDGDDAARLRRGAAIEGWGAASAAGGSAAVATTSADGGPSAGCPPSGASAGAGPALGRRWGRRWRRRRARRDRGCRCSGDRTHGSGGCHDGRGGGPGGWYCRRTGGHRVANRRSRDIRVEAKLVRPDAQHVAASQNLHTLDAVAVHEQAVGARVGHDVSGVAGDDLGVAAGDIGRRDHHVAPGIPPEDETCRGNHVLAAVDQGNHAAARGGRCPGRRGPAEPVEVGDVDARDELRAPPPLVVAEIQLRPTDLDLVPVNERRGFRTEENAVDPHDCIRSRSPDGHMGTAPDLGDGQHRRIR